MLSEGELCGSDQRLEDEKERQADQQQRADPPDQTDRQQQQPPRLRGPRPKGEVCQVSTIAH